ncbi:ankyrin repeat domain-containing protein, partial [Wolbachia endosymbiont of Glossina morsitans morsitans]|uniref:ankyrin repeat domain-containing protein n=1 Tax=Wolbachia endosymbiont of Glossina morsitans morsitans TaxID=1150948 RepID=UPI001F11A4D0
MPEKIRREMFLSLAGGSEEQLKSSVDLLVEYSMVNDEKEQGMLSIHRLVQEVTRLNLKTEQDREEKVLREALELIKEPSLKEGDIANVASILNYASRHDKLIADPGFDRTYGEYQYTSLCLLIRFNQGEKAVKHLINNIRRMKYPSMLIRFVNSADNLGHSPLRLAIENGNLNIVKYLIENGADYDSLSENDMTLLHIAASCGQLEVVKYLVADRGANIEAKDSDGMTPLHTAASRGSIELAKYFVTKRSNVNEKSYKGYTPLHLAAERGFLDTVKYLIKEGADLGAKDHKGYTPLHLAAERGFLDIVEYLINKGASYDIKDYRNLTPLDLAEKELAQDPENDNLIKIKALLFNVKDESKSQHREEGTSGSFSARECLPSTSSGIRRNKRNAENECLFAWEDVDEFSEKKNENRDFSKVEIDSEKFVDYVKDLPEEKRSQLIQLADEARVKGRFQGLVNRLISNQKIMSHLTVVERISGIAMHGMMAKNVLADFLNGNYQGVAVNVGFIAGGQGFAKIAEAASLKGLKLVTEGKLLVGNSLRAASPFLARGTSAFVIYDLVNQVKAFKNGTDEALVGVIGDSIYLGVDAAEIGIEVAEAFEVLEGVSSVTGPIGAAVGAVVFFCTDIHMAVKRVDKIDQIVHLKGNEKFTEGLRASMGMQPEQYIEELIEKKQVNNQLVNQGLEYLKQHSDIQRYVFPTGELVIDSDQEVSHKPQMDLNNLALLGNTVDNVIWHRARPDNSNVGKLFCLPTGPIRSEVGGENAYLCHNAIGLFYIADRTGNSTLIALGKGRDRATGFRDSPNIFLVDDGNKELTGG